MRITVKAIKWGGGVTLRRSLTGRYKIEYIRYGDGGLRDAVVENGGRKYLLLGGRDAASQAVRETAALLVVLTKELSRRPLETLPEVWYNPFP